MSKTPANIQIIGEDGTFNFNVLTDIPTQEINGNYLNVGRGMLEYINHRTYYLPVDIEFLHCLNRKDYDFLLNWFNSALAQSYVKKNIIITTGNGYFFTLLGVIPTRIEHKEPNLNYTDTFLSNSFKRIVIFEKINQIIHIKTTLTFSVDDVVF